MTFYSSVIAVLRTLTKPLTKVQIEGLENIPAAGGAILVPNHLSNLDPILLGIQVAPRREVKALAKNSLFRAPVIGSFIRKMGHIPVKRNSASAADALKAAVLAVKNGEVIAIYPEGTIPPSDQQLGDLKSGAVRLALETGVPLIPIAQWGPQYVLPPRVKNNWKFLVKALRSRVPHRIVVGEPYTVAGELTSENISVLTAELKVKLEELVAPLRT